MAPCSPPIPWKQREFFAALYKDVIQFYKEFGPKDHSGLGLQVLWLQPLAQHNSSALCLVHPQCLKTEIKAWKTGETKTELMEGVFPLE